MEFKGSQVCPGAASLTFEVDLKPENQVFSRNLEAIFTQTVGLTLLTNFKFLLESKNTPPMEYK